MVLKNKFTITLSDINGSKHYLLHQIIKKFILYFTLGVALVIVLGALYISFLKDNISALENKKEVALKEQEKLEKINQDLQISIAKTTQDYESVKEKVSDMEELIGLKPIEEDNIEVRLDEIEMAASQQKEFFENIPNGFVIEDIGISEKFGWRINPILKSKEFHKGIDLRAKLNTPVYAPADGVVEYVGFHKGSGFGNMLIVRHNFGFQTQFAHLSSKEVVKEAQFVKKGDLIAYTGNSGMSTGPHLHYEIRFVSRPLDPINFLNWSSANFAEIFKKEKRVTWESLIKMINRQYPLQRQLSLPQVQQ